MADKDLEYKIKTTADTTGAEQAAAGIGKVDTAAKQAGKGAEETAQQVNGLGESFDKGAAAGRVLGEAMRGNVMAIGSLGPAIKGLATLLKTNLIGALVTLGAIAANVLLPIIRGFTDTKKKAEDATKSIDAVRAAAERAGALTLASLQGELAGVAERATGALAELDRVREATEKIAAAEDDRARARINANPALGDRERALALRRIDDQAQVRQAKSADDRGRAEVEVRRSASGEAGAYETETARRFRAASDQAAAAQADLDDLARVVNERRRSLRSNRDSLAEELIGMSSGDPERAGVTERIKQLDAALKTLSDDTRVEVEQRAAVTTEELAAAAKALDEANRAALKSLTELRAAEKQLADQRELEAKLTPIRDETRRIERTAESAADHKARADRIAGIDHEAREAAERGDWDATSRLGKERGELAREQAAVQRSLDGAAAAAAAVKVPELNAEPLRVAVVQMGDQTIKVVGGLARDLAATKSALEAQKREMEKLGARLDNLAASSQ